MIKKLWIKSGDYSDLDLIRGCGIISGVKIDVCWTTAEHVNE